MLLLPQQEEFLTKAFPPRSLFYSSFTPGSGDIYLSPKLNKRGREWERGGKKHKNSHSLSSRPPFFLFLLFSLFLQFHIHVWVHRWFHCLWRIEQRTACVLQDPAGLSLGSGSGLRVDQDRLWNRKRKKKETLKSKLRGMLRATEKSKS